MFFASKNVIGLDIGSSSIKLAELSVSKSGAQLLSFGFVPTPPNSVSGDEISDVSSLGFAIKNLLTEVKVKSKNVCTSLWGTAVIVKKISIPKMDKNLIKDQIRFEAEQYIPFDINNISLAYHILKPSSSGETMDILLIAAQNALIGQVSLAVEASGSKCSIMDVSGFALANCYEANYGSNLETVAVLNFGASITNFIVIQNGDVVFCRDMPVGGLNYTTEISKTMGVTMQEAESLKLTAVAKREVPDDVHSIITMTNNSVAEEVRNNMDLLSAVSNGLSVSRLYYTGGSSHTPGLIDILKSNLGIATEAFNPLLKIKANSKKFSPQYLQQISPFLSVAAGLGLRKMGDS